MNGNFFAKPNKLRKSVSFVTSVFKKEKGKQIYPIYLKKINAILMCYSWKLMLSRKAKHIISR